MTRLPPAGSTPRTNGPAMLAYAAAGLFVAAALLSGANVRLGPLTPSVLLAAGLACLALHLAGVSVGTRAAVREHRR
jgi:hypothetical protein